MRRNFLSIAFLLVLVVGLTACGQSGTGEQETSSAATEQSDGSKAEDQTTGEAGDEGTSGTEAAEQTQADHETYTEDTEITDEMLDELYTMVAEVVKNEYLEPKNVTVDDLGLLDTESVLNYDCSQRLGIDYLSDAPYWSSYMSGQELQLYDTEGKEGYELANIMYTGIVNWVETQQPIEIGFYSAVMDKLFPDGLVTPFYEGVIDKLK